MAEVRCSEDDLLQELADLRQRVAELESLQLLYREAQEVIEGLNQQLQAERTQAGDSLEALSKSRERLELALQGSNDGLWDWNLETDEVYYSPRWKSMLGYEDPEIEHHFKEWERLVDPADRQQVLGMIEDYLSGKADKFECEFRMRHKDGHYVDVLSRAFAVRRASDGKPVRVIGTHVDITARKHTEQALRESRRLLYTVVNSAPIVLFALDCDGVFTLSEGQELERLGLWPGEIVGRSVYEVYKDVPQFIKASAAEQEL